jgi:DNA-binding response OmpR family regulator
MSKILVVEHEPNLRRLYRRELADVVVVDAGPPPGGLAVVERMLALDRTVPIVLNTTYRSYTDDPLGWAVDAYVDKSSDLGELRAKVHELLCSRSEGV